MSVKYSKNNGTNTLSYLGVSSIAPPKFLAVDRPPRNTDLLGPVDDNHPVGTHWLDTSVEDEWILASIVGDVPNWVRLTEVFDNVIQIDADFGIPVIPEADGNVNVLGGPTVSTSGVGNTLSLTLENGTDGQLLIAGTATDTIWSTIASTPTITITTGANTINLESTVAKAFDTLSGDSGTANAVGGKIDLSGGTNIFTTATADVVSVFLDDNPDIPGTLTLSMLASAGVLMTNGSGVFSTNTGTDGQVLVSGGTAPIWANLTSSDASITITNGPNTINLETAAVPGLSTLTADDANTATPTLGKIDLLGDGIAINTSAGGDTLLVALDSNPEITGTLTLSPLTTAGIVGTNGSGVANSSKGTDGQVLIGGGTSPTWANITAGSDITVVNGANTIAVDTTATIPTGSESFMAYQPSTYEAGQAVVYYLGDAVVLTEAFDTGSNFYPGDGAGSEAVYTAPVDGIYYFQYNHVSVFVVPPAPPPPAPIDPPVDVVIETTNYDFKYYSLDVLIRDNITAANVTVTTHLDAGDTVKFWSSVDFEHAGVRGDATDAYTYVSGYLIDAD